MYPGTSQWGSRPDETQALRFKQIDSLRQFFPTVKEVSKESVYEVPVTLPRTRQTITIRITLVRDFPRVPPTLQILPAVTHKFVDTQMFVTPSAHENLSQWTVHTNLGKTVLEIVQKFMQDPPQIVTILPTQTPVAQPTPVNTAQPTGYPSNTAYPNPSMTPTTMQSTVNQTKMPPPYGTPAQPNPNPSTKQSQIQLPPIPQSFPDLESKTYVVFYMVNDISRPSELSHLLNDELEFNNFFEGLSCVQTVRKLRDDLRENNEALAKKSLALEAEIEKLKQEVASRQQTVSEKKTFLDSKLQRQHEIMKQYSTANLIEKLGAAATDAENSSDVLAQKFLSGEIEQKDFVKDFMEKRKLYHLRAAKRESLLMMAK